MAPAYRSGGQSATASAPLDFKLRHYPETPPLAGVADFGLEVGVGEGITLSAGYRGLFSERLRDNQVGVKLKASW